MRKDSGTYGDAQRIEQLAWTFFLKILDDRETEEELLEDDFKSPLPQKYRWRNWAADDEGMTGDVLLDFVDNQLIPSLKKLPASSQKQPRAAVIRGAFEDANQYMKNGTLMRQVINKINEIDFNNSKDRHLFGDVYEQILKDLQSAGNAGEFLHAPSRHAVHGSADRPAARRNHPRPRLWHWRLLDRRPSTTSATKLAKSKSPPTKRPSKQASTASRKSTCRTSSAPPTCSCTASTSPRRYATTTRSAARFETTARKTAWT